MYADTSEFIRARVCDMDLCGSICGGCVLVICGYTGRSRGQGRKKWWEGGGVGG